jgi:hypothetical protein
MHAAELIDHLEPALTAALGDEGFDLEHDEESGAIELATDDWTLVLEDWPSGIAFLALDDEPVAQTAADLHLALKALIGAALGPLAEANRATDGGLGTALKRTSDPLSNALAALLTGDEPRAPR